MPTAPRGERGAAARTVAQALVVVVLAAGSAAACRGDERPDPAPTTTTLFGSNVWQAPGETRAQAADRVDATYGPIDIARVFAPALPPTWAALERDLGDRPLVLSFRTSPAVVLSGAADERLTEWFRAAPTDRDTYWVYFHEPEDETERGRFTPQQFTDAWSHVARLAEQAGNPRLRATVILMCWTAGERSGRDWRDFVPDPALVDVLAWDCYAKGTDAATYADPVTMLEPARRASEEIGAAWAIGELGARVGHPGATADRAAWLAEVGAYAADHGAEFVTYFDAPVGGEFRLTDDDAIAAWARLTGGGAG